MPSDVAGLSVLYRRAITRILTASFLLATGISFSASSIRFLKSQSGPSGKIVDNKFLFDEVRNRFVFPQDKSLTVYFEWEAPPGDHTLSAFWKDPEGRVASISPDVKMQTRTSELHAYWIYELAPGMRGGIWTVEIRIDGEPAGTHSFELMISEAPPAEPVTKPEKLPTLNEIYAAAERSLVWIYKLDETGRRIDTSLGFVIAAGQVATAFQSIDGAARVELEFANGRKIVSDEVWAFDRMQDWALVKADTQQAPALRRMESGPVPVGERYLVFNVETGQARVIGGVDITGRRTVPSFGDRIQISPSPTREAVGGPFLNPAGLVAGIVGGSTTPGSRLTQPVMSLSPGLWFHLNGAHAVTPIGSLPLIAGGQPVTLRSLMERGGLTPSIRPTPSIVYGGVAKSLSKNVNDTITRDASEFSHGDQVAWVYTIWQKREKAGKGVVSARVYDSSNRLLVSVSPRKITLPEIATMRVAFDFTLQRLTAGIYRVDVFWNDQPAWRTFFTVTD